MDRKKIRESMCTLLNMIETNTGKIYTLELREIGTWRRADRDITVGNPEERQCSWQVSILEKLPRHSNLPERFLNMVRVLNGIYDSYEQIRLRVEDVDTERPGCITAKNGLIYHTGVGSISTQTTLGHIKMASS